MFCKVFFLSSAFFILLPACYSQQFNVSWSDDFKVKDDYSDAVQLDNGNYLLLKFEKMKSFRFYSDMSIDPWIMLVDSKMNVLKENQISIGEKNDFDRKLIKYGKNIFLLFKVLDNSSKTGYMYAIKINEQTLLPKSRIQLGSFDAGSQNDFADLKFSTDSSKVLLFAEAPDRKKENKKFYICVLDTGMKKIWSRSVELPIGDRFASIYDQDVTNEGKVFVAVKHYDKEVSREAIREEGDKIPSYTYKLLVYSKDILSPKQISVNLSNHFIQGTKLIYGKNGVVTAAGLYKKKPNGNIVGTFYATLDSSATEINNTQMVGFTPEILELVDKDGLGKSGGSDPGIYPRFRIRHIITRSNGSVDLISEYYEFFTRTSYERGTNFSRTESKWTFGDIININLDKTGKAIFTRIPKYQENGSTYIHLGYYAAVVNDKLVLFYNDDEDNMSRDLSKAPEHYAGSRKSVLAAAIIDAKGNLSRQAVFSYRDENQVAQPFYMSRISDSKYLIMSARLGLFVSRTKFGVVEIK